MKKSLVIERVQERKFVPRSSFSSMPLISITADTFPGYGCDIRSESEAKGGNRERNKRRFYRYLNDVAHFWAK